MKVLKVATYDWKNASRDKRELSLYRELGHDVYVLCKGNTNDYLKRDNVDGFDVFRCTTRPLGSLLPRFINRIVSTIMWVKCIMKINPDVISGENPNGAFIGVIAKKIIKDKNIKLIYDAHEFHLFAGGISNFKRIVLKILEKYILRNADLTIVVNDSILCEMKKEYKFNWNAVSILSTPNLFSINHNKVKKIREYYDSKINKSGDRFIIEFHGYITRPRNVELLFELLNLNTKLALVLIGYAESNYKYELEQKIKSLNIEDRVLFEEGKNEDELCNYLSATDIGIILYKNLYKNFYYMSPNKFFENIQAENPVICSNFPELARIINKYDIGMLVDNFNLGYICKIIECIRNDHILYMKFKKNLVKAKNDLCWEREKIKLIESFNRYIK